MTIKVTEIPDGYEVRRWGHIGNRTVWWNSAQQAYLERRILLKYNPRLYPETFLVYHNIDNNMYTVLQEITAIRDYFKVYPEKQTKLGEDT